MGRLPDEVSVCDVPLRHGQSQMLEADKHLDRRQELKGGEAEAVEVVAGGWTTFA